MKKYIVAVVLSMAMLPAIAQKVQRFSATKMGAVSLDTLADTFNAQLQSLEAPEPDGQSDKKKLIEIKTKIKAQYPNKPSANKYKTTVAPAPIVSKGFLCDSSSGIPPDNDFAVNINGQSVAVMNSSIATHRVDSGLITKRQPLRAFASAAGLNNIQKDYKYDPKVLYDAEADKWICVLLNATNERNFIIVGFSQTNDAMGVWNFYRFYGDYGQDSTWFDYPAIAVSKDELFLTGNKIKYNGDWKTDFVRTVVYQFQKSSGYSGDSNMVYQIWDSITHNGKNIRNLYPVKSSNNNLGSGMRFLSNRNFDVQNDTIFLVDIPNTIASGNNIMTIKVMQSPITYGVPPDARQADTALRLATNDGRILGAFYRGDKIQFVSTTIDTSNGASGVFHGEVSNITTIPVISKAHIISVDSLDFGYPNISFVGQQPNGQLTSIINFNHSGPKRYAGMSAVLYDDVDYSPVTTVKEGDTSIRKILNSSVQRWGDYSGSQKDFTDINAVWVNGIFGRKTEFYGNWAAKLTSPLPNAITGIKTEKNLGALYPNPSFSFITIHFDNAKAGVKHYVIEGVQGSVSKKILSQYTKRGANRINFDIQSLAPGMYVLQVLNEGGEQEGAYKFVKQ